MNAGLLPGFGRSRQGLQRVVGLLRTPTNTPSGYGSVLAGAAGAVIVNPGSVTAGVLTEYLNIRGAGVIHWLNAYSNNGTNRDIRAILTLDGADVIDHTAAGLAGAGIGPVLLGAGDGSTTAAYQSLPFNNSLVLQASGSLTETGGWRLAYVIELRE